MPDEKDRIIEVLTERLEREGARREEAEAALKRAGHELEAREVQLSEVRRQLEDDRSRRHQELEETRSTYQASEQRLHDRMQHEQTLIRGELDASNSALMRLRDERADLQERLKDRARPRSPRPTAPERAEVVDSTVGIVARTANRLIRLAISFGMVLMLYHLIYAPDRIPKIIELLTLMVGSGGGYAIPAALLAGYSPKIIDAIRKLQAGSDD